MQGKKRANKKRKKKTERVEHRKKENTRRCHTFTLLCGKTVTFDDG
jgi:hypothetical protein